MSSIFSLSDTLSDVSPAFFYVVCTILMHISWICYHSQYVTVKTDRFNNGFSWWDNVDPPYPPFPLLTTQALLCQACSAVASVRLIGQVDIDGLVCRPCLLSRLAGRLLQVLVCSSRYLWLNHLWLTPLCPPSLPLPAQNAASTKYIPRFLFTRVNI